VAKRIGEGGSLQTVADLPLPVGGGPEERRQKGTRKRRNITRQPLTALEAKEFDPDYLLGKVTGGKDTHRHGKQQRARRLTISAQVVCRSVAFECTLMGEKEENTAVWINWRNCEMVKQNSKSDPLKGEPPPENVAVPKAPKHDECIFMTSENPERSMGTGHPSR